MFHKFFFWLGQQWQKTKRYYNLKDRSQTHPPALVWIGGGIALVALFLLLRWVF
jgi:hypothetical protein